MSLLLLFAMHGLTLYGERYNVTVTIRRFVRLSLQMPQTLQLTLER